MNLFLDVASTFYYRSMKSITESFLRKLLYIRKIRILFNSRIAGIIRKRGIKL